MKYLPGMPFGQKGGGVATVKRIRCIYPSNMSCLCRDKNAWLARCHVEHAAILLTASQK